MNRQQPPSKSYVWENVHDNDLRNNRKLIPLTPRKGKYVYSVWLLCSYVQAKHFIVAIVVFCCWLFGHNFSLVYEVANCLDCSALWTKVCVDFVGV